jgi:hypothetical protein
MFRLEQWENALILVKAMPKLQSLFLPWESAKTLSNRYEIDFLRRRWLAKHQGDDRCSYLFALAVDWFLLNKMTRKSRPREMIDRSVVHQDALRTIAQRGSAYFPIRQWHSSLLHDRPLINSFEIRPNLQSLVFIVPLCDSDTHTIHDLLN